MKISTINPTKILFSDCPKSICQIDYARRCRGQKFPPPPIRCYGSRSRPHVTLCLSSPLIFKVRVPRPPSIPPLQAITAIAELRDAVDTLIVVANDKLLEITAANIPLERAFSVADDILRQVLPPLAACTLRYCLKY